MHFDKLGLLSSCHSVLSSTNKFSPNVCSSGEWNSLLQECEGWLFYLSGNFGHILLFFKCLISPLFNKDGLWFAVNLDGMYHASHSKKIRPTQSHLKFLSGFSSLPRPSLESPVRPWMVLACQPADFTAVSNLPLLSACLASSPTSGWRVGLFLSPPAAPPQVHSFGESPLTLRPA